MTIYKTGKITAINKRFIIFEANNRGELIYVAKSSEFEKNKFTKLYVYHYKNDYMNSTYGFKKLQDRNIFKDLLDISGVGPKTSMCLLKEGSNQLLEWIISDNINAIAALPFLNATIAKKVIFELKDKYQDVKIKKSNKHISNEIVDTLKILGFKTHQIDYAIKKVKPNENLELMIEEAIKLISNAKFT